MESIRIKEEECKHAAKTIFSKYEMDIYDKGAPRGCFRDQDGSIFFNSHPTGGSGGNGYSNIRVVCRRKSGTI